MGDTAEGKVAGLNVTRRRAMAGAAMAIGGLMLSGRGMDAEMAPDAYGETISRTSESIHHAVSFKAGRKRVYEVLTDTQQFDKVVHLSDAMKPMPVNSSPTSISTQVGGAFALFGGHIVGRQIELVPGERIVQVWRVEGWEPGI